MNLFFSFFFLSRNTHAFFLPLVAAAHEELHQVARLGEGARKHQRDDGHQLDENVQRGTRRVLEWVTDRVTDHGSHMHVILFAGHAFLAIDHDFHVATLNVLRRTHKRNQQHTAR